jgi:EAL domain-containing protein (putative c-di-GMP-specific phosphodiesterase class I)/CheY-like chemotaxis protein
MSAAYACQLSSNAAHNECGPQNTPHVPSRGSVLLIDDDRSILKLYGRILRGAAFLVVEVSESRCAAEFLADGHFDVVVTDVVMPTTDGVDILRAVREHDPDMPVVLMSGTACLDSALAAVEHGAIRYLRKPVSCAVLIQVVEDAVRARRTAEIKRQALQQYRAASDERARRLDLIARFEEALRTVHVVFQPIVRWHDRTVFAHEALVRSEEPTLGRPSELYAAAERLDRLQELGRTIRSAVAAAAQQLHASETIFVNVHPRELEDDDLLSQRSPLAAFARRVVLEVTEWAALDTTLHSESRLAALRDLGYRFALDDLGAGYAGLTSFAQLRPEVVKLDMALTRGIAKEPTKRKLVQSMIALCLDLGVLVIAEGVETRDELDTLVGLGCDLLQGYLFARPGQPSPAITWNTPAIATVATHPETN